MRWTLIATVIISTFGCAWGQTLPAKAGRWTSHPALPLGRGGAHSGLVGGRWVVAGGSHWVDGKKHYSGRVDTMNPTDASPTWGDGPEMPEPRAGGAYASDGNSLYVLGGADENGGSLSSCLKLEVVAGEFRWSPLPPLPQPRAYGSAGVIKDRLVLAGGVSDPNTLAGTTDEVLTLDLKDPRDGWKRGAPVPGGARSLAASAVSDGKLHLFGGCRPLGGGQVENLDGVAAYDPGRNRWTARAGLPAAMRGPAAAALDKDEIAVVGGNSAGPADAENYGISYGFERRSWIYDVKKNRFRPAAPLSGPVAVPNLEVAGGRVWVTAGEDRARSRRDWTVSIPASEFREVLVGRPFLVCLGDSVTDGVGRSGVQSGGTYPRVLERIASGTDPAPWVIAAGRGGETTRGCLDRMASVFAPLPRIDYVVVMYGLNDAALVDPGPAARTAPRISAADYEANLSAILSEVRRQGAAPILCTPNPMTRKYRYGDFGAYRGMSDINETLKGHVEAVRRLARQQKIPLVDIFQLMPRQPRWEERLPDGIHPDTEGLAWLAGAVNEVLKKSYGPKADEGSR